MTTIPREIIELDLDQLDCSDEIKTLIKKLLNLIAELAESNVKLQEEVQQLKGERADSYFNNNDPKSSDSSRDGRKRREKSKEWKKGSKKGKVKIDRTEIRKVDRSLLLPPDADFKGYRSVVKQNILIQTDNVEYKLEQWYSQSEGKLYEADLPPEAPKGEFGPDLEALIISLNHMGRMPHDKIHDFISDIGTLISKGQITNILNKTKQEEFSKEREDIYKAGMNVSEVVHTDSTGMKHKAESHHIHVLCNELFSYFSIEKHKDRPTLRKLLRIPEGVLRYIILVADDARQYLQLCVLLSLCWLHEIRHYEKLNPVLQVHQKAVEGKLGHVWEYYFALREYKEWACKDPPEEEKLKRQQELEERFDAIFTTPTGYDVLDHRLSLTAAKKERLLVPLYHPHVPLHNNDAERPLREPVIRRRISGGTKSEEGKQAWENMLTIKDTCRKHDVSFYHYLCDIISERREMTPLSTLIQLKVNQIPITY